MSMQIILLVCLVFSSLRNLPVYCSQMTAVNIGDSKNNFSKYIGEIKTFELDVVTQVLCDNESFTIGAMEFLFMETPGHSPGGACIFTSDAVFTGDNILNQMKAPLNFPHSNKKQYDISLIKIKKQLKPGMTIFPGHGEPFKYNSWYKVFMKLLLGTDIESIDRFKKIVDFKTKLLIFFFEM